MADLRERLLTWANATQASLERLSPGCGQSPTVASLRAVVELHKPSGYRPQATYCTEECRECRRIWPCPTLLALAGPLGLTEGGK